MSNTPRTDAAIEMTPDDTGLCCVPMVSVEFARTLERELEAAHQTIAALRAASASAQGENE